MSRTWAESGGAAYPISPSVGLPGETGQSLRDAFAIAALPAVIVTCADDTIEEGETRSDMFARKSYAIADAMLWRRDR